jgi:hypothetical protein
MAYTLRMHFGPKTCQQLRERWEQDVMNTVALPAALRSFEDLGLGPGDRLQFDLRSVGRKGRSYSTSLIGYVPGTSVLVRTPLSQGFPLAVVPGDVLDVQIFSGRHSCSFGTQVLRLCRAPVHYLHLAYPEKITCMLIRDAMRVRVNLPGVAMGEDLDAAHNVVPVTVADLSISGAQVGTTRSIGRAGDSVQLAFKFFVQPNDYLVKFNTRAIIQNLKTNSHHAKDALRYGLRFDSIHPTEGVLLQSYLHQAMLADRSRFS